MKTKLIYFVHGTTYDNASKKCSGWKQVELNELGKEQAANLGKINSNINFDVIFTSDLVRAIESADIAFPNVRKVQDKRLRECNYGDLDGEDKNLIIYEDHIDVPFPNGESLKDVELRIKSFIDDILKDYKGKTIGIVTTHEGSGLANVVDDIRKICKGAVINDFIAIKGSECINAKSTIENWL